MSATPRCARNGWPNSSARRRRAPIWLDFHRGGAQTQRGAGPRAVRRSARPRQDHAGADRGARTRRRLPRHLRPGDRQGRRSRGAADQSRRARRAVHRRNPSPQPGGRGSALSGDGGFPARPHHRRGAGGAFGQDRTGEVHAGRRHHARGPADQSAARPLRHSGAAEFLHRGRAGTDRHPRRARARHRHDAGWRQRDRPPRPRHAAHRRPAAAPGAGFRLRGGCRLDRPRHRRSRAAARSRSTPPASTPWTGAISPPSR